MNTTKEYCLSEAINIIKAYAGGSTPRTDLASQLEEVYNMLIKISSGGESTKWS